MIVITAHQHRRQPLWWKSETMRTEQIGWDLYFVSALKFTTYCCWGFECSCTHCMLIYLYPSFPVSNTVPKYTHRHICHVFGNLSFPFKTSFTSFVSVCTLCLSSPGDKWHEPNRVCVSLQFGDRERQEDCYSCWNSLSCLVVSCTLGKTTHANTHTSSS